ncbi:hypothetical protein [Roseomonas sp. BN140053]|uniref:hypothetical protein n=1 Tax=Roseomonas sp. BN140053 TaxID=3391898 RepID=UPI0039E86AC8
MSAAATLRQAEAAGVQLHLDAAGQVRVRSATRPPPALLTALRQHRDEVAHLLTLRTALVHLDHDAAEADAMAEHYLAPAELAPPAPQRRDAVDEWLALPASNYGGMSR